MKKTIRIFALLLILGLIAGSFTACKDDSGKIKIGISLPTQREERWTIDYRGFIQAAEALDVEVIIQIADNDAALQLRQVENMITMGVQALIIAPHDAGAARQLIQIAHAENIPVIVYDRPVSGGNADLYICVNQFEIGRAMGQYIWDNVPSGNLVFLKGDAQDNTVYPLAEGAKYVLQPRLDSGEYNIVMEQFVVGWEPARAMRLVEQALTVNRNNIQGVIAPNDGTAGGIIQALAAEGLAGIVPVTGQDAEIGAIQRILAGTQGMTILYDNFAMAEAALQAAVRIINGEDSGATSEDEDGTPMLDFQPVKITKDNWQLLIERGLITEDDLK